VFSASLRIFEALKDLKSMDAIADIIKHILDKTGRAASLLILAIMAAITWEVVSRYVFNHPTSWVWLINKQLFGIFVMIAGAYAVIHKSHIQIEMLYEHFPPWMKGFVRWLTLILSVSFLGALTWKSTVMGLLSLSTHEQANGVFRLPLYPLKLFMPVAAFCFLLGCIATYTKK
jgi:TRAP-type mannitol/chloroaromatic compound transport system permease small subunit